MTKQKLVSFVPDLHGVQKCVDFQKRVLPDLMKIRGMTKTIILHEAIPLDYDLDILTAVGNRDNNFEDPQITLKTEFNRAWKDLNLQGNWGPAEPYLDFFRFADKKQYRVGSLDGRVKDRQELARDFANYARRYVEGKLDDIIGEEISLLRAKCLAREQGEFIPSIVRHFREEPYYTHAIVITHPGHIDTVRKTAKKLGYQTNTVRLRARKVLGEEEDKIQLRYATDNRILRLENPPLVPSVTLAWGLPSMVERDANYWALHKAAGNA